MRLLNILPKQPQKFSLLDLFLHILYNKVIEWNNFIKGVCLMWRNILSIAVILILVGIVAWNQIDWNKEENYNVVDVTGDTSVEGVAISPPNANRWKEGDTMFDIELSNLEGDIVSIYDSSKPIVLINFWATWCPPCKEEMPDLDQLHQEKSEQIDVFAINVTNTETSENKVQDYQTEHQFSFEILLDKKGEVYDHLKLINLPVSFFVDTETHEIVKRVDGALKYEQMVDIVEEHTK